MSIGLGIAKDMSLLKQVVALLSRDYWRKRRELKAVFNSGFEQARRAAMLNVRKGVTSSADSAGKS